MRFLNEGDSFSGDVHLDQCVKASDHKSILLITESSGNAVRATVVSKVGSHVRSWKLKGFFHVGSRKLILAKADYDSRALGLVCSFSSTNDAAECQVVRDNFSKLCGSFIAQRDYRGECCYKSSPVAYL